MKYQGLQVPPTRASKRLGRGIASGKGKTAGRGTKGQGARAGSRRHPGFEGGQNPMMQRLPKLKGFTNQRAKPVIVYTGQLEPFSSKVIDPKLLSEQGLINDPYARVKLLVGGTLSKKVYVKLQAASASAIAMVQQAGGTFEVVPRTKRQSTKKANRNKKKP